jgi:hypothetical protein
MAGRNQEAPGDRDGPGILSRIEEKLDRLLGRRGGDWHDREWAPLDSPFAYYEPGDPSPRFFGGPRADAPGWDPSLAGPRFDRIDVGAVGTHAVDPVSSFHGAQHGLVFAHNSAREYYLLRRQLAERGHGQYADYRRRKIDDLDRDYADYCRERQAKFDRDFEAWRDQRKSPRQPVSEPTGERAATEADARESVS